MPTNWNAHRLPKPVDLNVWGEALVTTRDHFVEIATWEDNYWAINGKECAPCEIIAWMPLPQPYEREEDYAE